MAVATYRRRGLVGTQNLSVQTPLRLLSELPRGWLAYGEETADHTGFTADTDLITLSFTPEANRWQRISGFARCARTVADGYSVLGIKVNGTYFEYAAPFQIADGPVFVEYIFALAGGTTATVSLGMFRSTGTGTVGILAGSDHPAWLMVEDIGPSNT